jgi:hypothetical protein
VPEEDLVHVQGQDLLLRQRRLEAARQDDLLDLAAKGPLGREDERLHDLLGDGRRALLGLARAQVGEERAHHAAVVDALVGPEAGVLGGDEGVDQDRRHVVEADQGPALVLVDLADPLGRRDRRSRSPARP